MNGINYTFIIPHHNCPDLLARCLSSIPQRDDIQIIVVDDNSDEDKKPAKCGRSEVEYIYIDKAETKGAGRARNVGMSKAKGKWLLFPDADDQYIDNFLNCLDEYKNLNFDILYFNSEHKDCITGENIPDYALNKRISNYDNSQNSLDNIKFRNYPPWDKMLLREFVLQHKLYFEEVPNGNDILFSLLAGYCAKNIHIDKRCLYTYYRNTNGIVLRGDKSVPSILCKIEHRVKLIRFYNHLGFKDYDIPILKYLAYLAATSPLSLTCKLFFNLTIKFPAIYMHRKEWVEMAEATKTQIK